jgi:hypothetical protein
MKFTVVLNIILLSCFFVGCQSNNAFEDEILAEIKLCSSESTCTINISQIMNFEWDEMYIFKYNATYDDVQKAIGLPPKEYTEFTRKIIFTSNGKVVYFKELPTDISGVLENEIIFDIDDAVTYKSYFVKDATFSVAKEEIKEGKYFYELTQLKN